MHLHLEASALACTLALASVVQAAITDGYLTQGVRDPWSPFDDVDPSGYTDSSFSLVYGQKTGDSSRYDGTALMFNVSRPSQIDPIETTVRPLCGRYNRPELFTDGDTDYIGCSSNGNLASYPGDYKMQWADDPLGGYEGYPQDVMADPWTPTYYDRDECYKDCQNDDNCVAFNFYFRFKANFIYNDVKAFTNGVTDGALYDNDRDEWIYQSLNFIAPYVSVRRSDDSGNLYPSWNVCERYSQFPDPVIRQQPVYPVAGSQWWFKNNAKGYDEWVKKTKTVW